MNLDELEGWYSKSKAMATNNVYTAVKKRGLKACVVYPVAQGERKDLIVFLPDKPFYHHIQHFWSESFLDVSIL